MKLFVFVIAFALLSIGCVPKKLILPSPDIPHELAEEGKAVVWCGTPDRKLAKCEVRLEPGWWLASPQALSP